MGEYSPIGSMVKNKILSLCEQSKKTGIFILTYIVAVMSINVLQYFLRFCELPGAILIVPDYVPPPMPSTISAISMGLLPLHKMGEIRPGS